MPPINEALIQKTRNIRFNCSFVTDQPSPEYLEWVLWKDHKNRRISLNEKLKHPSGPSKYEIITFVKPSEGGLGGGGEEKWWMERFDLVVKDVGVEDGTRYECSTLLEESRAFVELIVLGEQAHRAVHPCHPGRGGGIASRLPNVTI